MRTERKLAVLSLAILAGACSKGQDRTAGLPDDLKKDLAAASASGKDLAIAPQHYQRMRFVSDIEQSRASVKAQRPKVAQHSNRLTTTDFPPDPIYMMAAHQAAAVATPQSASTEPSIAIAARPAPEPASASSGASGDGGMLDGDGGGGGHRGIGGVVIRGGHGGTDKCDPRTDGRGRPGEMGGPNAGMPLPTGLPVFGGGRHR